MFTLLSYIQRYANTPPSVTNFFRVSAANSHKLCTNHLQQMYNETPEMLQEQAYNVMETVEDIVEHICDENMMSGEKVWVMISALCEAKLAHFPEE